jgi:hypothetical protein
MKVTVRDQIGRIAHRIAVYQWWLDHPRIDSCCRFCGTSPACACLSKNKRSLAYAQKRLASLRAESRLTPEEVEGILEDMRSLLVASREIASRL